MFTLLSSRRHAFTMLSLLVAGASASAACTLDVSGRESSGAGGSTSSSSGTMTVCAGGTDVRPCYGGPAGTEGKGLCKGGQQTCKADGSGFGDCVGAIPPAMKDDCAKNLDTTCDEKLVCPCTAGMPLDCYEGPDGTVDVGICKAGMRTCQADGMSYGPCENQQKPALEDCSTPKDEDCNNLVFNDTVAGCMCEPKTTSVCTTALQGLCKPGKKACLATGKDFGECEPDIPPTFDDCFSPADEDCDGTPIGCTGGSISAAAPGTTTGDDSVFAVATDAAGNIFLGGVSGASDGSNYGVTTGSADITKLNNNGVQQWKKSYPATGVGSYSVVRGVAVDGMGSVIIVGEYKGMITSNGVSLTSISNSPDVFVIKLDTAGTLKWSKTFGSNGDQFAASISAAANGDVFIIGTMSGQMTFGTTTLDANGSPDVFVARLAAGTGDPVWSKNFGDGNVQYGWHVAATPDGNVVVTGQFEGNIDFGGGYLGNGGNVDIYLAKLDGNNGTHVWSKRFGEIEDQVAYGIAADASGNIVITGSMQGKIDFGGGPFDIGGGNPPDAFVARFAPDGAWLWSKLFGDPFNSQVGRDVAVDGAGNVLVTGFFTGTLQIDATVLVNPMGNGGASDVFVAKLKADGGSLGWARKFGDSSTQLPRAITVDPLGNVIFGGIFSGTIDFAPPAGFAFASMNSTYDGFWAKLAP